MEAHPQVRRKVLKAAVKALDNEEAHVRFYCWLGRACGALGLIMIGTAVYLALREPPRHVALLVVSGGWGGLLLGLFMHYRTSVQQWPVIREFIDPDAIRKAAREDDPRQVSGRN